MGGDIYLAIMGRVFDVTRGRDFYGPGGGYSFFSGKYYMYIWNVFLFIMCINFPITVAYCICRS